MFEEEPKDMFEGVDPAAAAPAQAPAPAPASAAVPVEAQAPQAPAPIAPPPTRLPPSYGAAPASMPMESRGGGMKVVLIVVGILVIFGVSGFFAYRIMVQPASDSGVVDAVPSTGVTNTKTTTTPASTSGSTTTDTPTTQAPVQTTNPASLLDSDGDGLTNARELEVGTSVTKADTDGDGLGDREEVEVYGTDPRKPDTDGDGYLDGQEVSGGYNPNGSGKLFTVPQGS